MALAINITANGILAFLNEVAMIVSNTETSTIQGAITAIATALVGV